MANLILLTGGDPDALLRTAAAPFCVPRPVSQELPLLAVRQGGLRDAVHEMAGQSGAAGWLGNPIVVFAELADMFSPRAPLYRLEREALLARIMEETALTSLRAGSARRSVVASLDRFFGDLVSNGATPTDVAKALEVVGGDAWSHGRNADVAALFAAYTTEISKLPPIGGIQRSDGRDGLLAAAEAIAASKDGELVGLRRPFEKSASARSVDIFGLADLRRGWRAFLGALAASPAIDELRLYVLDEVPGAELSEVRRWAMANGAEERVVAETRACARPLGGLRRSVLTDSSDRIDISPNIAVIAAPDITRELEDVARAVKRMLVEGNDTGAAVHPRDIAMISRQARPYLTRAAEVFERYGIPTYARLRHTLSEVSATAALLRVFRAAAEGWTGRGLREIAGSPYFTTGDVVPEEAAALNGERELVEWIDVTIGMCGGIDAHSVGFLNYAVNVHRVLEPDSLRILRDAARADATALRSVVELLGKWRIAAAMGPKGKPFGAERWAAELERTLSEEAISVRTGERGGVQLLEASASEGQSWSHVFVVGMSTGSFPAEPARDLLFSDGERQRLAEVGLPVDPPSVWREREMALFRGVISAPSTSLRLSYAYADPKGSPQLRSAYLDDVAARVGDGKEGWVRTIPGSRVVPEHAEGVWCNDEALLVAAAATRDAATSALSTNMLAAAAANGAGKTVVAQLLHAAVAERARSTARAARDGVPRHESAHEWNGRIDDPELLTYLGEQFSDRTWSATQLEAYGRCGFSFFGKYILRATELEQADDEELSARDSGTLMHAALAATYERLLVHDPEAPLSSPNAAVADSIVAEEVARAFDAMGVKGSAGLHTARIRETTTSLQQYVRWEMESNDKAKDAVRPAFIELSFGMDDSELPPAVLEAGGRKLRLKGKIDRVDELIPDVAKGYYYIVDHKSGGSALSPVGKLQEAGAILQLALYIAALERVLPNAKPWGGAYQLVADRKATAALNRCSIGPKGQFREGELKGEKSAVAAVEGAARLALSLVDGVLAGRFAARVPDGTHCLSYCAFKSACREERIKQI